MKKFLKWMDVNFEPVCMLVLFYSMLILITLEVILRFIFSRGIAWSEEVSRYLFVWLIYFSISYACRNNRHIRVLVILKKFPEKIQKITMVISDVLFLTFTVFLLFAAKGVINYNSDVVNRAITVNISINILYMAGFIGFILMSIRISQSIIWKLNHWSAPMKEYENFGGTFFKNDKICFVPTDKGRV